MSQYDFLIMIDDHTVQRRGVVLSMRQRIGVVDVGGGFRGIYTAAVPDLTIE